MLLSHHRHHQNIQTQEYKQQQQAANPTLSLNYNYYGAHEWLNKRFTFISQARTRFNDDDDFFNHFVLRVRAFFSSFPSYLCGTSFCANSIRSFHQQFGIDAQMGRVFGGQFQPPASTATLAFWSDFSHFWWNSSRFCPIYFFHNFRSWRPFLAIQFFETLLKISPTPQFPTFRIYEPHTHERFLSEQRNLQKEWWNE